MADAGFVNGMTPFLRESLGVHGEQVLDSDGVPVVTVGAGVAGVAGERAEVGRKLLRTTHRRADERLRAALTEAVADAVADPGSEDALGALRQVIRKALSNDPGLEGELAALLPSGAGGPVVIASGERSIAAGGSIGVAITGDGHGPAKR